jgi:formamidopyrimidine-DNA glycosylase
MLRLHDPRRFGAVVHVTGEEDPLAHKLLDGLGMEPLDPASFRLERFAAGLQVQPHADQAVAAWANWWWGGQYLCFRSAVSGAH